MNRRDFISKGSVGAGAALLAPSLLAKGLSNPLSASGADTPEGSILEPSRQTSVVSTADVVVIGGGPAGFAAAVAAAREGADVMLLERQYFLGGLFTGCGVTPIIDMYHPAGKGRVQAVRGIAQELCSRLDEMRMIIVHKNVHPKTDPEAAKYVMEQITCESGVRMLYGVQAVGVTGGPDRIEAVIIEGKGGRMAIRTSFVVDCSGDGDVLAWRGEPFTLYKDDIGAMWRIGNADNSPQGALTPVKGVRTLNTTGETGQDGLDVFNLTRVQTKLRKQIWESTMALRQTKGCEDLYLVDTPSVVGVRITRVLDSVGNVTVQGALRGRKYSDAVGVAGAFTDIRYKGRNHSLYERKMWQVPYSALTPRKTHNLLVAGRCIGVERGLTYDAREIGTCLLTGQAAGAAAAMAVSSRRSCRDIDVAKLRETLRAQGVYLP